MPLRDFFSGETVEAAKAAFTVDQEFAAIKDENGGETCPLGFMLQHTEFTMPDGSPIPGVPYAPQVGYLLAGPPPVENAYAMLIWYQHFTDLTEEAGQFIDAYAKSAPKAIEAFFGDP